MHTESPAHETLWKLIKDIRFGMLTHRSPRACCTRTR